MIRNFKNKWPLVALSLLGTSSTLLAANDAQMRNVENRLSALEQRKGSAAMVNPSGRPQVQDGADLFVTGDLLLWKPSENGLGFAIENNNRNATPNKDADVSNPSYKYDWGFRVGLGYNLPHDGWDLYANWTHFNTRRHTNKRASSNHELFTTFSSPATTDAARQSVEHVSSAMDTWRLHLNLIDLEMGREFFVSKWTTLRPFVGLRTAWVHQRDNILYQNGVGPTERFLGEDGTDDISMKCNFWGLGARAGLNSKWGLGYGVSVYGNAAISLLYGYFSNNFSEQINGESFYNVNDHYRMSRAVTDLALGLRWDHHFKNDCVLLGIQAGWEQHMFFGMNQFMHFTNGSDGGVFINNLGDLSLQGWTLSARIDF